MWRATPRQFVIVCDAYRQRRAWLAWHTGLVANGNVTAFEQLNSVPRAPREEQSPAEMAANLAQWRAIHNLTATTVPFDEEQGIGG